MRYVLIVLCLLSTLARAGYVSDDNVTIYDRQTQDSILIDIDSSLRTMDVPHAECSGHEIHAYAMSISGYSFRTIGECIDDQTMPFRAYEHNTDEDLLSIAEQQKVCHVNLLALNLTFTTRALD